MISRIQRDPIKEAIKGGKLVLLSGPFSGGKKTIVNSCLDELGLSKITIDCSNKKIRSEITASFLSELKEEAIIFDEAQFLSNLHEFVDLLLDGKIDKHLILLCSYTPALADELLIALQASKLEFKVYPPSFYEAAQHFGLPEIDRLMEERLVFGNYAMVLENPESAELLLLELVMKVFRTNLGGGDRINKEKELLSLLRKISFQIGEIVTYHDLGQSVGLDNETVERYIDLLEKADIIIRLKSFSSGLRYELKKTHCLYFIDNGIRNALIQNFNSPDFRNDMPALWKNFLISEKIKWYRMHNQAMNFGFWRTHTRQQMDFLEFSEESMSAFKIDWEKRKKVKIPSYFSESYPNAKSSILNRSSYWSFLAKKLGS